jgi:hypothetical protein
MRSEKSSKRTLMARLISMAMVVVLTLTTLTACIPFDLPFGNNSGDSPFSNNSNTSTPTNLKVGDTITNFGGYDWQVLDVQNGAALIITTDIIERSVYNEVWIEVTWETCALRGYLNGDFYDGFSASEQARIKTTRVKNPANAEYGTLGGNDTADKVFLLSIDEVEKYFPNDKARVSTYNGMESWWWLRTPGFDGDCAAGVESTGAVDTFGRDVDMTIRDGGGVRPVLWLQLQDERSSW